MFIPRTNRKDEEYSQGVYGCIAECKDGAFFMDIQRKTGLDSKYITNILRELIRSGDICKENNRYWVIR